MPQPLSEENFRPASHLAHRHEHHFDPLVLDLSALWRPVPSPVSPPHQIESFSFRREAEPVNNSAVGKCPAADSIYENVFIEDFERDPFFRDR